MKSALFLIVVILTVLIVQNSEGETIEAAPYLIGGSRVKELTREYAVLLRLQTDYRKYEYRNGVRLNERWILTAAECLERPKYTHVRFTYSQDGKFLHSYSHFNALKYFIHPTYNGTTKKDNIALIQHNSSGWKSQNHLKIPPRKDSIKLFVGAKAEVTAFQHITDPDTKEEMDVVTMFPMEIQMYTLCYGIYPRTTYINWQICATSLYTGQPRLLTTEDIGAPVVLKDRTLFGILLEVRPLSDPLDERLVFYRIFPYFDWIKNVTGMPV